MSGFLARNKVAVSTNLALLGARCETETLESWYPPPQEFVDLREGSLSGRACGRLVLRLGWQNQMVATKVTRFFRKVLSFPTGSWKVFISHRI